ncbi:MAG: Cna B-type domain-containing protein [Faecousia sp.]
MKRVLRTALMALLIVIMCAGMAPMAMAAENAIATAEIPITIYMEGKNLPASDTVTAEIAAVTEGAPLPENTTLKIECKGPKTVAKFKIDYTKLGIYKYTVTIKGGSYYLAEYGDDLTYHVTVSVINNSDYSGYNVEIAARLNGKDTKSDISDTNIYLDPLQLKVVKRWIDQDSSRPSSISVDLLCDGEVVRGKTLTLSAKNNWQATWDDLDPRLDYSVKESKVPAGYTASYKEDAKNHIWTITNTGSLLQTGQLNWPIPVLFAGGVLLLGFGLVMMFRKREENDE